MDGLTLNPIFRNNPAKLSYDCNAGWMDGRMDMLGGDLKISFRS